MSSRPGWAGRRRCRTRTDLSKRWGADVWLKREDLAHTGAHKINNAVGQTLLAKRLGAKRIIAETGAGQHGVASAAAAARFGMPCVVYMGAVDVERQAPNVGRMQLLGATVVPVTGGDQTLRAAIDEALRDWVSDPDGTYYCLGIGRGAAPVSLSGARTAVGDRPRGAGADAGTGRRSAGRCGGMRRRRIECHRLVPSVPGRCRGAAASASKQAAAAPGLGDNAASLTFGTPGVLARQLHADTAGCASARCARRIRYPPASIIPASGPEHAYLMKSGRVAYESATDEEALDALAECAKCEGILARHRKRACICGRAPLCANRIPARAYPDRLLRARRQGHADSAAHAA